ncbi:MAG: DUF128 domain-containing protein [Spirochaetales bacterium]|nr:DUF128 domain-containing protein [Spirochaetales bacterium]
MSDKVEKKKLSILRILGEINRPTSSHKITEYLNSRGYEVSERTVRFHLLSMDKEGLTEYVGRHGRRLTELGRKELSQARVFEKVGFLNSRIDEMTCLMNFDPATKKGRLIVNTSLMKIADIDEACEALTPIFDAGFCMGELVTLFTPGMVMGGEVVPEDSIGLGTICSFNLNGIMVRNGIPVQSLFGGLIEIHDSQLVRFLEIIKYAGTSIEPLEIFIKSGMLDFSEAAENGNARVGGNFMEIPSICRERVLEISNEMEAAGLGKVYALGWPGHSLLEIPLNSGRIGGILLGGLNPLAEVAGRGISVVSHAVCDLVEYNSLFHYSDFMNQVHKKL